MLAALVAAGAPLVAAAFTPANGTFHGLFSQTNGVWQQSAGLVTITTTWRGTYSANVQVERSHYHHSGMLSPDGAAVFEVPQAYGDWLRVAFQVSPADADLITGSVSNSVWAGAFSADREVFDGRLNVCPDTGRYTLILPGDPSSTNSPGGDSFGTVYVSPSGHLTFSGFLADGHSVSQSALVSKDGRWPLFLPLYDGNGALYSWLFFNNSTNGALSGTVDWEKPALSWEWYYPAGFSIQTAVIGSHYARPPSGTPVLNFSNAWLEFNGGQLQQSITNYVVLTANDRVLNLGSGWLSFSLSPVSGKFSGRYRDYSTWEDFDFYGVMLPDYNFGGGCFPGWDQSGQVRLIGQ